MRSAADGPLIELAALAIARAERIASGDLSAELESRLASWTREAARLLEALGMSPRSRAELGLAVSELRERQRRRLELSRLSDDESAELRRLLEKAAPAADVVVDEEPDF